MFTYTASADSADPFIKSLTLNNGYGAGIDILYDIGKYIGLGQLFFALSGGIGSGVVSGSKADSTIDGNEHGAANISGLLSWCAEISLVKKFYIGRVAIVLQPEFGYQSVILTTDSWSNQTTGKDEYYMLANSALGFAASGGLEIALSPAVSLGVGAGYQVYGKSSDWDYSYKEGSDGNWQKIATVTSGTQVDHTGVTAKLYLVWSLPSLAFDPLDMLRGVAGGVK